jgi:ABC-type Fe3+ transport system permease subunit/RNA polymerase subunit RPABC4/transcription elongation factor Spt4
MSDYQQRVTGSFNERKRMLRLRRKKENLRFWEEFHLVPTWLKALVAMLYLVAMVVAIAVNLAASKNPNGNEMFPPDLRYDPVMASLAMAGIVTAISLVMAVFIFMIAYVNRDAKRRGMNSALWTLLVLILSPGYLIIGFLTYFLMREPLPYPCPQCANSVGARFNFCPNCKCNLHPSCAQCKREIAETDKFCPYCGNDLKIEGGPEIAAAS